MWFDPIVPLILFLRCKSTIDAPRHFPAKIVVPGQLVDPDTSSPTVSGGTIGLCKLDEFGAFGTYVWRKKYRLKIRFVVLTVLKDLGALFDGILFSHFRLWSETGNVPSELRLSHREKAMMSFQVTYRLTHPEYLPTISHATFSAASHQ